jgi:A/G-specific adenine glycosylase
VPKSNLHSSRPHTRRRKVPLPAKSRPPAGTITSSARSRLRLHSQLIAWFRNAARDLPWRRTRDPYAILVSEIMLQQTQVATVIPFYERWLARFPDFASLAAVEESDVLTIWQGLGYYSRARNLHRAARTIVENHGGEMPRDPALIRALPGIGRYTAGAVASFAFDLPEPLVDANVARVLARLLDLHTPIDSAVGQAALWSAAKALLPQKGARIFNGALMELGAILCTPRAPQCLLCPIREHCTAYASGTAESLPRKKPRRKQVELTDPCAWTVRKGRILLEQQTGSRWRGLWKLPSLPAGPNAEPLLSLEYPFTHHRVTLTVFAQPAPSQFGEHLAWHPLASLAAVPLTAPHRRAIEQLAKVSGFHLQQEPPPESETSSPIHPRRKLSSRKTV